MQADVQFVVRSRPALPALHDHAAEERRLDGADDEAVVGGVIQEVADVLVLLR